MNDQSSKIDDPLSRRFGPLARHMLTETPLSDVWRLSLLANFYTGPTYAALQAEMGIGRAEFVVLFCLSQREGMMARDIVSLSGLPKNSVSRAVVSVTGKGLVRIGAADTDRRAKPLHLTAAGADLMEVWVPRFAMRQEALFAPLTPVERDQLRDLLTRLAENMPTWIDAMPDVARVPEAP